MLALGLFALALFVVRLTGLPNLFDNECRLGESVLDVVQHGNWLCPHDALGHTDKPPLLAWLSALVTLVTGRVDRFTLYLPSAVATAALAGLVLAAGRRHFGWWAGFLGGLVYLASEIATKQVTTARWDALFALTVTLAALAAFCAWTTGRGWVWFWLAAAAPTLTKGPLGVLLAGAGLAAAWWERASGPPWPVRGTQAAGIGLYLALALGWFLLAWRQEGSSLVENMLGRELLGHAIEHAPGRHFTRPLEDFFGNFAPWSLAAALGLGRTLLRPAADARARRCDRARPRTALHEAPRGLFRQLRPLEPGGGARPRAHAAAARGRRTRAALRAVSRLLAGRRASRLLPRPAHGRAAHPSDRPGSSSAGGPRARPADPGSATGDRGLPRCSRRGADLGPRRGPLSLARAPDARRRPHARARTARRRRARCRRRRLSAHRGRRPLRARAAARNAGYASPRRRRGAAPRGRGRRLRGRRRRGPPARGPRPVDAHLRGGRLHHRRRPLRSPRRQPPAARVGRAHGARPRQDGDRARPRTPRARRRAPARLRRRPRRRQRRAHQPRRPPHGARRAPEPQRALARAHARARRDLAPRRALVSRAASRRARSRRAARRDGPRRDDR